MRAGDIFYSVMQKDNYPFEQPRITKFIVEVIDNDYSYPIISTKKDKWGRYYAFKESQIYLTYKDALVEKKKIIEKIEKWEKEKREQDRLYFEEQERKEKQRQIEHEKQVQNTKAIEVLEDILINLCSEYFTIFDNNDVPIRVLEVQQISSFINNQINELRV